MPPAAAPVSEALVADLYMRVERVEAELRQLQLLTPAALRPAPRPPTVAAEAALTDTRLMTPVGQPTPVIRWPVPRLPGPRSAPAAGADLLQAAFDLDPVAAVGLDAGGMVRAWNPAAAARFGWTAAEVVGRPPPFVPADKLDEHRSLRRYPRSVLPGQDFETERCDRAGRRWVVRVQAAESRCGGVVFTFRDPPPDPTDPRPAGAAAVDPGRVAEGDADPALRRYAALGKVAAGVAHDFNAVLTVVRGYAELLTEQLPPGGALVDAAAAVVAAAEQGGAVSRHLMGMVCPELGTPPQADVGHLLQQTDRFFRSLLGAGVELTVAVPVGLPDARVDPAELFQVLLNLAANARDALPPTGGAVTVGTAVVGVPAGRPGWPADVPPGEFVRLAVSDTGHGMSAATRRRLFAPGFTTRPPGVGHGLGLATVKEIVGRAGGHVEVASDPAGGSTFTVYFRRA